MLKVTAGSRMTIKGNGGIRFALFTPIVCLTVVACMAIKHGDH